MLICEMFLSFFEGEGSVLGEAGRVRRRGDTIGPGLVLGFF